MNDIDRVFLKMTEFDAGDARRIQHFTKVYQYAHLIGIGEGLDCETQRTLEIAAIVHDIGIHPAEAAYGFCNGKLQEEMGPAYAETLLAEAGIEEAVIRRVSFLVGHHHTYKNVDALDWQILLEADYLVNAYEDSVSEEGVKKAMESLFRTKTGTELCRTMFLA